MSELPGFHPSPRARQSLANQTWQVGGKESALAILKRATRALQPAAHWEGAPRPARAGRAWEAEKGQGLVLYEDWGTGCGQRGERWGSGKCPVCCLSWCLEFGDYLVMGCVCVCFVHLKRVFLRSLCSPGCPGSLNLPALPVTRRDYRYVLLHLADEVLISSCEQMVES